MARNHLDRYRPHNLSLTSIKGTASATAMKILVILAARMSQPPIIIAAPKRVDPRYPRDRVSYIIEEAKITDLLRGCWVGDHLARGYNLRGLGLWLYCRQMIVQKKPDTKGVDQNN